MHCDTIHSGSRFIETPLQLLQVCWIQSVLEFLLASIYETRKYWNRKIFRLLILMDLQVLGCPENDLTLKKCFSISTCVIQILWPLYHKNCTKFNQSCILLRPWHKLVFIAIQQVVLLCWIFRITANIPRYTSIFPKFHKLNILLYLDINRCWLSFYFDHWTGDG